MRGLVLIAFGALLLYGLQAPLTGYATSQTCCQGDVCTADSLCTDTSQSIGPGGETLGFFVVSTLTALAAVSWIERK